MAHTKGTKHLRVLVLKSETRSDSKTKNCALHGALQLVLWRAVRGARCARCAVASLLLFPALFALSLSPFLRHYALPRTPLFFFHLPSTYSSSTLALASSSSLCLLRSSPSPSSHHTSSDARPSPILRNHRDPKVFCHCLQLEPPRAVDAKVAPHPSKIPDQTLD